MQSAYNPLSNVLLIGVDSPIGLTVLRELGAHGLTVHAVGRGQYSLGRHSRWCHSFVERPQGPIADWLPALVAERKIGCVMAVSEGDLVQLAPLKGAIEGCTVLVPDADALALVLDKQRTLDAARAVGIAVPDSWQPQPGDALESTASKLAYPVAIKWADPPAMAARLESAGLPLEKVEYAETAEALVAILRRYDRLGAYPLVQTWCPGHGLGQMLNMAGDKASLRFQHRRLREWPVSGGVSTYCAAVPLAQHGAQMEKSEALLASIGWQGPAMVEYRFDEATGTYWLMEINGRFWGSIPLAHHAGAQFGWEAYRTGILGERTPNDARIHPVRARYMVPEAKHLVAVLRDGKISLLARAKLAAGWFARLLDPSTHYYVGSLSDPRPLLADLRAMAAKLSR